MTTKDSVLSLSDKSKTFNNSFSNHNNQQYSNLNLNEGHQRGEVDPVQSKSNSFKNDERKVDETATPFVVSDYKNSSEKKLWNKNEQSQQKSLNLLNGDEKESEKQWKKKDATNDSNKKNSSTLSLHIAAYENSVEAALDAVDKEEDNEKQLLKALKKKGKSGKVLKDVKQVASTFMSSPFEIPRQQADQISDPEVMQFKSSQKMINPNATGSSSQSKGTSNESCSSNQNNSGDGNIANETGLSDESKADNHSIFNKYSSIPGFITRACLGRTAQIGDIYDATTEQILHGESIFNTTSMPDDIIIVSKNPNVSSEYIISDKTTDKLGALNINGEFGVSVMAGLIEGGSGALKYIREKINATEGAQFSFVQQVRICQKTISINDERFKSLISSKMGEPGGTHFVVGYRIGANIVVSGSHKLDSDEVKKKIEGELKIDLSKYVGTADCNLIGCSDKKDSDNINGLAFNVYADGMPNGLEAPKNFKEAKKYMKIVAQKFANEYAEGVQLELYLLPLTFVQKTFGIQIACGRIVNAIETKVIERLEQCFDSIYDSSAALQSLVNFVSENKEYIAADDKNNIRSFFDDFENATAKMSAELGLLVQRVRSGDAETFEIDIRRSEFLKNHLTSPSRVKTFIECCKHLYEKIDFVKDCQQNGMLIVSEINQLTKIKVHHGDIDIYMLFYSFKNVHKLSNWTESVKYFFDMQKQPGKKVLAVIDVDVLPNIVQNESLPIGIRVAKYCNGQYLSDDCLEAQRKMDSQCLAACDSVHDCNKIPMRAVPINFPCPKSLRYGKCLKENKEWFCARCRYQLVILDKNIYCKCGYNSVEEFSFKCPHPMHGNDYVKLSREDLENFIKNVQLLPEINILIIGENGVGKSTWINALANYISQKSIDDVLKNDNFINLIPTRFELTQNHDGQLIQKSIRVGTSDNENFTKGQSATQHPKAYMFRHNNSLYRIIDTPGIGDSRGIEQDKENMENIMQYISMYKEIHGICILMKPNEARLTPSFEFCFKELLVQFHRSAVENIVFCFTNTSGYNFQVAETLTPLSVLLRDINEKRHITIPKTSDRMYSFDNMAYRYLCAVKHRGLEFTPDEEEIYQKAYNISKDVTQKMLKYFLTRKAHNVEESISIYRARNLIKRLTNSLAKISAAVHETLEKAEYKGKMIDRYYRDEDELRKILIKKIPFKRWTAKYQEKWYCGNCITLEYYHDDDRLQFVEAVPSAMETNPYVLRIVKNYLKEEKDKCPDCGKRTKAVLGEKWIQSEQGTREEEDTTVAAQIKEKIKTQEGIIKETDDFLEFKNELTAERDAIVKASAGFAHFLGRYSITPYNDATEKYLKLLIRKEERMGNESKKILYENLLSQYDAEKITLEKQLKNASEFGDKTITVADIMETVDTLKKLKHYGQDIESAIGECNKAVLYEASADEMEVEVLNQRQSDLSKWFKKTFGKYIEFIFAGFVFSSLILCLYKLF